MAKKSRRARRRTGQAQPVRISRPARTLVSEAVNKDVDFAKEYHYVVEDLKRIFLIAGVLLILLVAVAFGIG